MVRLTLLDRYITVFGLLPWPESSLSKGRSATAYLFQRSILRKKTSSKATVIDKAALVSDLFPRLHNFQIRPDSPVICLLTFVVILRFLEAKNDNFLLLPFRGEGSMLENKCVSSRSYPSFPILSRIFLS